MEEESFNDYKERTTDYKYNHKSEITKNDDRYLPFRKITLITLIVVHMLVPFGLYVAFTSAMWKTIMFAVVMQRLTMIGVIGGAHRLWTHRSYKAKLPVRIFLMIFFTSSFQLSIWHWVRDHRVHHKYSETDADPHNSNRGMFFAHFGAAIRHRHPKSLEKLYNVDLTDIMADPVVRFNKKYYYFQAVLLVVVIPTVIPMYFWGETLVNSFLVASILRFVATFHEEASVNSIAHAWGCRPYDSNIKPTEASVLQVLGAGEGFHNYHHTFPFDYAASEFGIKGNITTAFIDLMSWFGLTYDLKTAPKTMIKARKLRNEMENSSKQQN